MSKADITREIALAQLCQTNAALAGDMKMADVAFYRITDLKRELKAASPREPRLLAGRIGPTTTGRV
jgi:hypothetical protein